MNIIINGGTRGIGKELALLLSQNMANRIIVTGRNKDSLQSLAREAGHNNIVPFHSDMVTIRENIAETEQFFRNTFTKIDILINNAGILKSKDFIDFQEDDARTIMETNFFGPATLIRILEPMMPEGSHIINISSMGGFQGSSKYKGLSYYSASKSALCCLTECLAEEFKHKGIRVNCLALGSVRTEMLDKAFPGYKAPVDAREMAGFIADFALNGGKFLNGKIIPVALSNP